MACECLVETNKFLEQHNTKLVSTIRFGDKDNPGYTTVTLSTEKLVPRKPSTRMFPTFCPFCGVQYRPEPSALPSVESVEVEASGSKHEA